MPEVESGNVRIAYEVFGDSGPGVLLSHGLGGTLHQWRAVAQILAGSCRVVAADLRGHGRSGKPAGPYSVRDWAADLAAVARAAGLERYVAVGASVGGPIVLQLAADHPDRVRAAVSVGGFAALSPAGRERMLQRAAAVESQGLAAVADAVVAAQLAPETHAAAPALAAHVRAALLANDPAAYAAAARAVAAADVAEAARRLSCPVLLVWGAEEKVAPWPTQAALKRLIPHAALRAIPGAGHLPFLERPQDFAAALQEFMAALPAE